MDFDHLKTATELELRDMEQFKPKSLPELLGFIRTLTERQHDYGTCVYAMSHAATAAFNYIADQLGVTGFQASCADMDVLRRTRGFKWGCLLNYEDLLYPQYEDHFPGWARLLEINKVELAKRAKEKLAEAPDAHPNVVAHWQALAAKGEQPFCHRPRA